MLNTGTDREARAHFFPFSQMGKYWEQISLNVRQNMCVLSAVALENSSSMAATTNENMVIDYRFKGTSALVEVDDMLGVLLFGR